MCAQSKMAALLDMCMSPSPHETWNMVSGVVPAVCSATRKRDMATYQILPQEPMCCAGDLPLNWKRFLKLFEDYAIATELTKKSLAIHVATPKRVMGKESKQILERLQLLEDELEDTTTVPDRLEADLVPARNGLYEKTATKRDD